MIDRVERGDRASSAVNWPPWNKGPDQRAGGDHKRQRRGQAQQHRQFGRLALDVRPPAGSPAPTWRLTCGRIAVPSAAPITPSGSWLSRSA